MDYNPVQTTPFSIKEKIKIRVWNLVNISLFKYSPFFLRKYRIALIRIFGGKIDWSCSINRKTLIDLPWNLSMCKYSSTGENVWLYCLDKISIGEKSCIGKDVYLLTGSHDINTKNFNLITAPIKIGIGVWISTGAYVLPGVEINNYSVVAAGSVVVKNVDCKTVVGGNPAKYLKKRDIKE